MKDHERNTFFSYLRSARAACLLACGRRARAPVRCTLCLLAAIQLSSFKHSHESHGCRVSCLVCLLHQTEHGLVHLEMPKMKYRICGMAVEWTSERADGALSIQSPILRGEEKTGARAAAAPARVMLGSFVSGIM